MKITKGIFLLLLSMLALHSNAQQRFIENGGQWPDQVHFRTDIPGGSLFIESNKMIFDRYDTETTNAVFSGHSGNPNPIIQPEKLQCHAYSMTLNGAILSAIPMGKRKAKTNYNYFIGQDANNWGENLSGYDEVWYENAYPNIDLKVYRKATLKYDFIIKSGGKPDVIEFEYDGVKPKLNEKGQIEIRTSIGDVLESKPFAYQIIDGLITQVGCDYQVSGKKVKFVLAPYRQDLDLIIDPELIFSTYSGSTTDNFGYTATYSAEGHLFSGSTAFGTGYPTTTGAYETEWSGGQGDTGTDIAITKFSLDGSDLEYSTYLGGTADELPHSLIADEAGNLFLFGTTGSDDYPLSEDAYQSEFLGGEQFNTGGIGINYANGCDIIISKLSPDGSSLLGSTLIGGTENDGLNEGSDNLNPNYADEVRGEIEISNTGTIIIGTSTLSEDFPMSATPYQNLKNASQDGVVFEMSNNLSVLISSTFFGGNENDAIYSIHSSADGTITVAGGTESDNLPSSPNAVQSDYGGGSADGMIAVFNSDLSQLNLMTYYGSSEYDQIYFIDRDGNGFPHIYGQTKAPDDTFIFQADYNIPNSGMLLSKFSPNLENLVWSTVFGDGNNEPNLSPTAFSVDICNRVYLSGWGGGPNGTSSTTTGLEVTDDALQSDTDGSDFYFLVLEDDASTLSFASFFGGSTSQEHVDGGTSRFDRAGKIYQAVCAGCGSNDDFPTEPDNVWSSINGSSNCNLGVAKIDFDLPLVFADFEYTRDCLPDSTIFTNTSDLHSDSDPSYKWFFPDDVIVNEENPTYLFSAAGTYEVMLVVIDPNACNLSDTIVKSVTIHPAIELDIDDQYTSCTTDEFDIIALNNGTGTYFEWAENGDFTDIILEGAVDSVLNYTTSFQHYIYLRISNEYCSLEDTILISPAPSMLLSTSDTLICIEMEFSMELNIFGGSGITNIVWSPEDKIVDGQGTENIVFNAFEPFIAEAHVTTEFGCDLIQSIQVDVYPTSLEASADTLACQNTPIIIGANSFGTAESFIWSTESDFSVILNPTGDSSITIIPTSIQYYYVQVENNGCFLKDSVAVSLLSAGTTVNNDQYICLGDTGLIFVSNDFPGSNLEHHWEPDEYIVSGQNTNIIRVLVYEPTTFVVVSETTEGCTVENSSTIFLSPLGGMEVEAFADPQHLLLGESSQLTVSPIVADYVYQWDPPTYLSNPNGTTTISTPDETITYFINILDFNELGACAKSDSVTIYIYDHECGEPNIFVPNTFTPNNDGENDELWVRGGKVTDFEFSVFDRWGEKVFETLDQSHGWDGTYKGNLAEPAVYVYYLTVVCEEGEEYFKKGNVTLLR